MTRREFLGDGFAAFAALCGGRLFAAPPGWKHGGTPNLVFGVISDTHLRTTATGTYSNGYWSDRWVVAALRHFRDQNVDAVMHCGDMAHLGQVAEMEFHRAAWDKVFPGDRAPDGRKVERLFVTGNHDLDASDYGIGELVKKLYPDEEERKKHLLRTDIAAHWERIWGEPYSDVWHRQVKGYHFFGRHYVTGKGPETEARSFELVKKTFGAEGSGGKPFFMFSHIRPRANMNKAMRAYPDAVSFFGHWHASAADWNRIFMWSTGPALHCPACCPQANNSLNAKPYAWSKVAVEGADAGGKSRQGYVVKVYDDMLVVERREFTKGGSLGPDWVMPLNRGTGNGEGGTGKHPFAKSELKKVIGEPQFEKNVKLKVESVKLKSGEDAARVSIPTADGNPDSRTFAYEVAVTGENGAPALRKFVYAVGVNLGVGHAPGNGTTTLEIPEGELPPGKTLAISVRPFSSLGTSGRPAVASLCVLRN